MDPEEFKRQSKEVYRNALTPEIRAMINENASAMEHYNAMLESQKIEAEKLCNKAFLLRVVDGKEIFTINPETIANFQQRLENYIRHNPMHNPAILHRLYEIYEKLPGVYAEDCLFSQNAIGHAHALSSARWLQHYAQGVYYLGGGDDEKTLEPPRRSFICRDSNPPVDIRFFIPSRFCGDSFRSIFGWLRLSVLRGGRAPACVCMLKRRDHFTKLMSSKNSKLSELVTQRAQVCAREPERRCVVS